MSVEKGEFDKFDAIVRKVFSVPRDEIMQREKEYQRLVAHIRGAAGEANVGLFSCGTRSFLEQCKKLAERVGFEPTLELPLNTLSKRAPSATRPSLRGADAHRGPRQAPVLRSVRW